jgi:hypothetical protein
MKNEITKLALLASIMLAMAFTFSCSGDDGNNGGTSSGSGGGGDESNQLYIYPDGTPYTGNGVIKIRANCIGGEGNQVEETLINAGSVTNGILNWQLPQIPDEYLTVFKGDEEDDCTNPSDIKILPECYGKSYLALVNNNLSANNIVNTDPNRTNYIGILKWHDMTLDYFSKAGTITCNGTATNVTAGWYKTYNQTKEGVWFVGLK